MMSHAELTPKEALFLWRIAAVRGESWKKEVKPDLGGGWKRLRDAGLIEASKRKAPGARAASSHLTLTDAGWGWLAHHLDLDLTCKSPAASTILSLLLRTLGRHMEARGFALAEVLSDPAPTSPVPRVEADGHAPRDVPGLAAAAYFDLSDGRPNVRVRLADLRRRLADVPRGDLDRALLTLQRDGKAVLYRLDDPREIHDEDREAVLRTPAGEERHIVYLEGAGR